MWLSVDITFGRNPYCGRGDIDEIRLGLIMTWVTLYSSTEFEYNNWSPFFQSPWKSRKYPHVAARATRRPIQNFRSYSPLWAIIIKLVSRITPSPLNRFPRFQLRCIPLENVFPAIYNTSGYVQGIPRKSM